MGTHLIVLIESYLIGTNMTGLNGFQKCKHSYALGKSSLGIGRVKHVLPPIGIIIDQTCHSTV